MDAKRLCKNLGYTFNDIALLERALTHRSVTLKNNERLEFLGDSIINFLMAEVLFQQCPKAQEGELSRLRAALVKGDTLAEVAKELHVGEYLKLGQGEMKSGGFRRSSILADALEAIIAAIYLDSDMDTCRQLVSKWFASRCADVTTVMVPKDPKTRLQEYLQAHHLSLPEYSVTNIQGEAHEQTFTIECRVEKLSTTAIGVGSSRRKAEQQAAKQLLDELAVKN